jgi:hypothetical protein
MFQLQYSFDPTTRQALVQCPPAQVAASQPGQPSLMQVQLTVHGAATTLGTAPHFTAEDTYMSQSSDFDPESGDRFVHRSLALLPFHSDSGKLPSAASSVANFASMESLLDSDKGSMIDSIHDVSDSPIISRTSSLCSAISPPPASHSMSLISSTVTSETASRGNLGRVSHPTKPHGTYQSLGGRTSVRQRISTWTNKALHMYSGRLGVLHEEGIHEGRSLAEVGACWRCSILGRSVGRCNWSKCAMS